FEEGLTDVAAAALVVVGVLPVEQLGLEAQRQSLEAVIGLQGAGQRHRQLAMLGGLEGAQVGIEPAFQLQCAGLAGGGQRRRQPGAALRGHADHRALRSISRSSGGMSRKSATRAMTMTIAVRRPRCTVSRKLEEAKTMKPVKNTAEVM